MAITSKCDTQPEYIERNKVYELIGQTGVARIHVSDIDVIPVADVAPVRHGRWENGFIDTGDGPMPERAYLCSQCGKAQWRKSRYCSSCGAKMDI